MIGVPVAGESPAPGEIVPDDRAVPLTKIAILIADKSPACRAELGAMLAPLGHPIVEWNGGASTLQPPPGHDVAAIVVNAPAGTGTGRNGRLARIHRRFPEASLIVIATRAFREPEFGCGHARGGTDVIVAPVVPSMLRATVGVHINLFNTTRELVRTKMAVTRGDRAAATWQLRQQTVLELLRRALAGADTDALMVGVVQMLALGTGSPMASLMKFNEAGDVLTVGAGVGFAPGESRRVPRNAQNFLWRALQSDVPVTADDPVARPPLSGDERTVASSAGMRVGSRDRPFGIVAVYDVRPRTYLGGELDFIHLIATVLSAAVQRSRSALERRDLLLHLVSAQEEERNSIAADIHDDAVQVMSAANIRLHLFLRHAVDPVTLAAGANLERTITLSIQRLRSLLFQLTPPALERLGLAPALQRQLDHVFEETGIRGELLSTLAAEPCHDHGIAMFRIFQEAVANIVKHANVSGFSVALEIDDLDLVMRIQDLGDGFASNQDLEPGHVGLASMSGRMAIAGGSLAIRSMPGRGTTVTARLPMERG